MGRGGHTVPRRGPSFIGEHAHDFGGKTIGMFAGVALLINNITGPGVPGLPNMFAEAGWLIPTVLFLLIWAMSSLSTTMYCEAMRRIPGNEHFRGRIEYTTIVEYYFGRTWYIASQIGLNGALQSLNIISVIQSAQVMDKAISAMFKRSCAFNLSPFSLSGDHGKLAQSTEFWSCIDVNSVSDGDAWGCHVVMTMGFITTLLITIPMGYYNLDDNMIIQVIAFVLTVGCWIVWILASFSADPHSQPLPYGNTTGQGTWTIPMYNSDSNFGSQAGVLGTILFNYGFVTTVPSWVNEKKPSVSVNKSVWFSTFMCNIIFFAIGIPGALGFKYYLAGPATNNCAYGVDTNDPGNCMQDLMSVLSNRTMAPDSWVKHKGLEGLLEASVYLFPIVAVLSSIPVFSIVIKYNCIENGLSKRFSIFWGVLFPWLVSIPLLYQPNALNQIINLSSLFFVSFTDFIVPWCLFIMLNKEDLQKEIESRNEQPLLNSVNDDLEDGSSKPEDHDFYIHQHFAFPQSYSTFKIYLATILVVVMGFLALGGVVLSIMQSSVTSWDCAAVSV
eukprot:m.193963 g.193963  ORF g.193963 m.193963 type:complete len:557 (+) comp15670_c0_seq5:103-1773(+)